ncbi:MAG TPA: FliH/SctL family protein [Candidatus Hydrogenedentes bacterium]|nr:FliH/SctL family protein [Candidatus Hydrogenedentota bacterium]HPG67894.1 FliH/SctL family protein [Candidatus Hydrogenedentota bacterium]
MTKVFRASDRPHNLSAYERETLEEVVAAASDDRDGAEGVSPERILAAAREEASCKVREAYEKGLRHGQEAGRKAFDESIGQCAEALQAAADAIKQAREGFLRSLEPQVVELALRVAQRILAREARTDRELVLTTVRRALEALVDRESVVIHIHPVDLKALREHRVALLDEFEGLATFEVRPDEAIEPGECRVDSASMHVDARFAAQCERMLDALLSVSLEPEASAGGE